VVVLEHHEVVIRSGYGAIEIVHRLDLLCGFPGRLATPPLHSQTGAPRTSA
jgi:hypothetical protein